MRQPEGSVRYGRAYATPVPSPDGEEGTPALGPWAAPPVARVLPVRARAPVRRNSAASDPGRTGEHRWAI